MQNSPPLVSSVAFLIPVNLLKAFLMRKYNDDTHLTMVIKLIQFDLHAFERELDLNEGPYYSSTHPLQSKSVAFLEYLG
jgi:hypothetical protein